MFRNFAGIEGSDKKWQEGQVGRRVGCKMTPPPHRVVHVPEKQPRHLHPLSADTRTDDRLPQRRKAGGVVRFDGDKFLVAHHNKRYFFLDAFSVECETTSLEALFSEVGT